MTQPEIEVAVSDICDIAADVVVLKHAQSFFGADAVVAAILTRDSKRALHITPAPGDFALVPTSGRIAAPQVVFVGVVSLFRFDYQEMRAFASRALRSSQPNCRMPAYRNDNARRRLRP